MGTAGFWMPAAALACLPSVSLICSSRWSVSSAADRAADCPGRWRGSLLPGDPIAGPPVPVEADGGKFIGTACGLNAKGPQPGVDSHVTPVRYLAGRVCEFSRRPGDAGTEDDRPLVPGDGSVDAFPAVELAVGVEHLPLSSAHAAGQPSGRSFTGRVMA